MKQRTGNLKMTEYQGDYLRKIAFPLGGIGAGGVNLAGNGRLIDWEMFNRPNKLSDNWLTHFALRTTTPSGRCDARMLHGATLDELDGAPHNYGYGPSRGSLANCPHLDGNRFAAAFPFARLTFGDADFPAAVALTAWSPFIPSDSFDSSLPVACFEWEVSNPGPEELECALVFSLVNPWSAHSGNTVGDIAGRVGITLENDQVATDDFTYAQMAFVCDEPDVSHQCYQSQWLGESWRAFAAPGARLTEVEPDRRDPASRRQAGLAAHFTLAPGAHRVVKFILGWYAPNFTNYWVEDAVLRRQTPAGVANHWRNWYAGQFDSAAAVAAYLLEHYDTLRAQSLRFAERLHASTLPPPFLEAASCNLALFKTPTCLRLPDGEFYGFEGCLTRDGSCEGSCMHVWNYAYALPYLFPDLERSMHDLEFRYNLGPDGGLAFRIMLPLGRRSYYRPCVDGQMGTVLNVYREWLISGDTAWLKDLWPEVKRAIAYAWSAANPDRWDPERSGMPTGRQHHTLDTELFGAHSWLAGYYQLALRAAARLAEVLGEPALAAEYRRVADSGKRRVAATLFNGEYFEQQVDLDQTALLEPYADQPGIASFDDGLAVRDYYIDRDHHELRFQIGEGCFIDQVLPEWHRAILHLEEVYEPALLDSALGAVMKYNFKSDFRKFFNPRRVYVDASEAGTILCAYPEGKRYPAMPIGGAEEVMAGFEYALAGTLLARGKLEDATRVVKAVRDRYDGRKRNPWNEQECGNNYARSQAAWSFVLLFSGFEVNRSAGELGFAPLVTTGAWQSFWSGAGAWGNVSRSAAGDWVLEVDYGKLELRRLKLALPPNRHYRVWLDGVAVAARCVAGTVQFPDTITIPAQSKLEVKQDAN